MEGCVLDSAPIPPNEGYFRWGAVVPPQTFVAADLAVVPTQARLAEVRLEAEDDASLQDGIRDQREQRTCGLVPMENGKWRCIPALRYESTGSHFAGSDCTGASIAPDSSCAADPVDLIAATTFEACGLSLKVHEPGVPWNGEQISFRTPDGCTADLRSNRTFVEIGPEVDVSRFVELETAHLGAHRLRARYYVDGAGGA